MLFHCFPFFAVIYGMYADDSFSVIQKDDMDRKILATEEQVPNSLSELFAEVG